MGFSSTTKVCWYVYIPTLSIVYLLYMCIRICKIYSIVIDLHSNLGAICHAYVCSIYVMKQMKNILKYSDHTKLDHSPMQ